MSPSSRIRVLQLITGLGPGGAERLVLDMMSEFDKSRFDVRLASLSTDLRALKVYGHEAREVNVFDLRGGFHQLQRLRQFVASFAPDLIHAHMFHALVAGLLTKRAAQPAASLCFTSHCYHQAFGRFRQHAMRLTKGLRAADVVFADEQHPHLNAAWTVMIPNGVPVPDNPPPRRAWQPGKPVRLIAVGRLMDQKDPLGLIRDFSTLAYPQLTLDFVGEGPLQEQAEMLARELGVAERVRFLGIRKDVRELMRAADVFVMRSKFEGMPMVLLEAGAEAMPVISTPVGAAPSMIGAERGRLARAGDFARALDSFLCDPAAALEMGRLLHSHVKAHHSIRAAAGAHEDLYAAVLNATRRHETAARTA